MGKYKNISDFYGKKLSPAEDDYSDTSTPELARRLYEDITLIVKDDSRKNGEVKIIREARK